MTLEAIVARFGYPALFVGAVLEGETALLIGAALAQQGLLDVKAMLLASALGAFAGDQFFFYLGRIKGAAFIGRLPTWKRKIHKAVSRLERHRVLVILAYRFIYGMRAVIPFLLGAGMMRAVTFTVLSAASAVAWAVAIGSAGYGLGEAAQRFMVQGRVIQQRVLLGAAVLVVLVLAICWWRRRRAGPSPPADDP